MTMGHLTAWRKTDVGPVVSVVQHEFLARQLSLAFEKAPLLNHPLHFIVERDARCRQACLRFGLRIVHDPKVWFKHGAIGCTFVDQAVAMSLVQSNLLVSRTVAAAAHKYLNGLRYRSANVASDSKRANLTYPL